MRSKKNFTNKYLFLISTVFLLLLFLYPIPYTLYPVSADVCTKEAGTNARANGLVSARTINPKFTIGLLNEGSPICSVDDSTSFVAHEIPTYSELKSLYYTQAKTNSNVTKQNQFTGNAAQGNFTFTAPTVAYVTGNLTLSGNPGGTQTGIIFVDGNTDITSNITYGNPSSGLVLVVQGDVNIAQAVTQINAVIISSGTICTAFSGSCPATITTCGAGACSQLVINGSLISLNESKPIQFKRSRGANDSTEPAERIVAQPKYLVILRHIIAGSLQKWNEITGSSELFVGCNTFDGTNQAICFQAGCQWNSGNNTCTPDTTAPTVPGGFTATVNTDSQITLGWTTSTDAVGVTGYEVLRCTGASCTPSTVITTLSPGAGPFSYPNTGLTGSTTYGYAIRARDAAGNTASTVILSRTTLGTPDTQAPTVPTNFTATPNSTSQITLNWIASNDNIGISGYDILKCSGVGCTPVAWISYVTQGQSTTRPDTGLSANTTYGYAIRAVDTSGIPSGYTSPTTYATTQAAFDYSLSNNGNITVGTSSSSFNNITATLVAGTTQSVTLSITPVAGVAWGWGSNPVNPTSILSLTATTTGAASGNYPITVTGTSTGGVIRTTAFTLKITNFPVSGAVAYWKMDEASGTNVAATVGSANGTAGATTAIVAGKIGNARDPKGVSSESITMGDVAALELGTFSFSAWVKPNDTSTGSFGDTILGKEGGCFGYQVTFDGVANRFGIMTNCTMTWGTSGKTNNGSTWYFVVATFDGTSERLYVNGNLEVTATKSYTINTSNSFLISAPYYLKATFDEIGAWNRALSQTEITNLYNGGAGLTYP